MQVPFMSVPLVGTTDKRLAEAAESYLRFLKEVPEALKRSVHLKSPFTRGSAYGHCDVRTTEGKDQKQYFHYAPLLEENAAYRNVKRNHPAARTFFDIAAEIYLAAERMAERIFAEHYRDHFYDRCFDSNGKLIASQLRILSYNGRYAKPHYDKGHGSIALGESTPGLRVGCCEEHMVPVRHNDGTAIFMPGQLMWHDSGKRIIPAWHDVVSDQRAAASEFACRRWAIVQFINDKDGRYPPHRDTHTPYPVHEGAPA